MISVVRAQQILFKTKRFNNISWICRRRPASSTSTQTTSQAGKQAVADTDAAIKKPVAGAPYTTISIGVPKETFLNEKVIHICT